MAVRYYLRYGLSCLNLEELLAERGIDVDRTTQQGPEAYAGGWRQRLDQGIGNSYT